MAGESERGKCEREYEKSGGVIHGRGVGCFFYGMREKR